MYSYSLLETGCYYLVQEKEEGSLTFIKVNMETDQCMHVTRFVDVEKMEWKKKNDPIFDILELLDDEKVKQWKEVYYNEELDYEEEEGDD
jgi:hypothetical protein